MMARDDKAFREAMEKVGNINIFLEAVRDGELAIAQSMVEGGIDVTLYDNQAIIEACKRGHYEMAVFLVEKGADVRARKDLCIQIASNLDKLPLIAFLVERGADIHACASSSVMHADNLSNDEIRDYLITKGRWERYNNEFGMTELQRLKIGWQRPHLAQKIEDFLALKLKREVEEGHKRRSESLMMVKPFRVCKK
jgi:ankyrin repeat protein